MSYGKHAREKSSEVSEIKSSLRQTRSYMLGEEPVRGRCRNKKATVWTCQVESHDRPCQSAKTERSRQQIINHPVPDFAKTSFSKLNKKMMHVSLVKIRFVITQQPSSLARTHYFAVTERTDTCIVSFKSTTDSARRGETLFCSRDPGGIKHAVLMICCARRVLTLTMGQTSASMRVRVRLGKTNGRPCVFGDGGGDCDKVAIYFCFRSRG